jgi:MscS family membrane protein
VKETAPKASTPKQEADSPKVTVEVNKTAGKDGPDVKVKVEGNGTKTEKSVPKEAESPTLFPAPGEKLTPLEAEKLDKAAEKVGRKVDELEWRLGLEWGRWVWTEAFLGLSWLKILFAAMAIALVVLLERSMRWYIRRRLRRVHEEGREETWREFLLDAASKPLSLFMVVYGTFASVSPLLAQIERDGSFKGARSIAVGFTDLVGTVAILWLIYRLLPGLERHLSRRLSARSNVDDVLVTLVGKSTRLLTIILGTIFIVQNVTGLEIGPVLASLGLGGLAVALAAKDSIANFFGTLTIIFDQPFHVGEQIKLDKFEGVVEAIGFRSTRIRTFEGALVSIPNEKAVSSGVENVGQRSTIRWHTNLGIRYDTPVDKVERAVAIVSDILHNDERVNSIIEPRVFFNGFNDSSLNIAVYAWFQPALWWDYQGWLQKTCFRILREFEKEGIEFAFPTRTLFVESNNITMRTEN